MGVWLGYSQTWRQRTTEVNREVPVETPSQEPEAPRFPPFDPQDQSLRQLLASQDQLGAQQQLFQNLVRINSAYGTLLERYPDRGALNLLTQLSASGMTPEQAGQQLDGLVHAMETEDMNQRLQQAEDLLNEGLPDPQSGPTAGHHVSLGVQVDDVNNNVSAQLNYRAVFPSSASTRRENSFALDAEYTSDAVDVELGVSYQEARERRSNGDRVEEQSISVNGRLEIE